MGRNHDEDVDREIRLNRPQPENLRMQVRDAIVDCLGNTESAQVTDEIMELAPDLADAVFDALGISEIEQDIEGASVKLKTPDNILSSWHVDDIFAVAKNRGQTLTLEEARDVLYRIDQKHDANIGINWCVIEFWVDEVVAGRKK